MALLCFSSKGEALPCCLAQHLPSAHSSLQDRVQHEGSVLATEVSAPLAVMPRHGVTEPPDPHRGVRSFLRRHAWRNWALPVGLKPGERESPMGVTRGGLGKQTVAGRGVRHRDKPAYISASPGWVAQATRWMKQQNGVAMGALGMWESKEGEYRPFQGARIMQHPQTVTCSASLPQNLK